MVNYGWSKNFVIQGVDCSPLVESAYNFISENLIPIRTNGCVDIMFPENSSIHKTILHKLHVSPDEASVGNGTFISRNEKVSDKQMDTIIMNPALLNNDDDRDIKIATSAVLHEMIHSIDYANEFDYFIKYREVYDSGYFLCHSEYRAKYFQQKYLSANKIGIFGIKTDYNNYRQLFGTESKAKNYYLARVLAFIRLRNRDFLNIDQHDNVTIADQLLAHEDFIRTHEDFDGLYSIFEYDDLKRFSETRRPTDAP